MRKAVNPKEIKVSILVTSDKRDEKTDLSGKIIEEELRKSGFIVVSKEFCKNDKKEIKGKVKELVEGCDCLIITGGTGISRRDVSVDALLEIFEKEIPGFGEYFRRVSLEEVGHFAILSRAVAGIYDGKLIFCIPGSENAAKTGIKIIGEILPHAAYEVKR